MSIIQKCENATEIIESAKPIGWWESDSDENKFAKVRLSMRELGEDRATVVCGFMVNDSTLRGGQNGSAYHLSRNPRSLTYGNVTFCGSMMVFDIDIEEWVDEPEAWNQINKLRGKS